MAVWPKKSALPGLLACVVLTVAGAYIHSLPIPPFTLSDGQHPISRILLALLLGMLVRNLIPASAYFSPGVNAAIKQGLPVGIVLLGAGLDFYALLGVALHVLVGASLLILLVVGASFFLARRFEVNEKMGILIGAGTAICGSSAILAVAPVVEARDEEVAYSIGVINLLGVVAMLVFPVTGSFLELEAGVYGAWCGLGIHATPQVIAAGFAHTGDGQTAGEMATIVKLVRISLLGPAVFVLGVWYARQRRAATAAVSGSVNYSKLVPGFVLLFLGFAFLHTLGFLPEVTVHLTDRFPLGGGDHTIDLAHALSLGGKWIITAAIAAVGLSAELRAMKSGGARPLLLGIVVAIGIGLLGLLVARI